MRRYVMLLALLPALGGCIGPAPAPVSSACAWDKVIHPSPDFEARWTSSEMRQVDEHNKAVRANCPPS